METQKDGGYSGNSLPLLSVAKREPGLAAEPASGSEPFDFRPKFPELLVEVLVTAVNVVDA